MTVRVSDEGPVRWLRLSHPEKRNALSPEMVSALQEALDAAKGCPARCVALTGEGEAFSAGADLKALDELSRSGHDANLADSNRLARLFGTIATHPLPVIAAVNGHAIAGGAGLAVACDLSIAAEGALFGFTEVRIGFVPAIILNFILRAAGEKAAKDLCLTGRRIDAAEAVRRGLLTEVVPASRLATRVREIGAEFAKAGPDAVAATKSLFLELRHLPLDAGLRLGAEANARSRAGAEWREGVRSFLEKRKPAWDR